MNTGPGRAGDPGRLSPEERSLADRLARLGPQGEPSPELDARILAAARTPAPAPAPRLSATRGPRRRQRRWPVAFGAAATLVIVGGLAWQLRPLDELQVDYSEAPRAASGPSAEAVPAPLPVQKARQARPAPVAADAASGSTRDAAAETIRPAAHPGQAGSAASTGQPPEAPAPADARSLPKAFASKPAAPAEPPVVFDEPSPMDTPRAPKEIRQLAPPPPAPPAPPPAASPSPPAAADAVVGAPPPVRASGSAAAPAEREARTSAQRAKAPEAALTDAAAPQVASGTVAQPAKSANAAAAADASMLERIEVTGARDEADFDGAGDQPLDDQPPASVDSPQVQQAWLQRVRQLVAQGRPDAARESLREYQRRYPRATLPDDLRTLLDQ